MTFFDREGRPMELMEWAKAYGDFDTRVLARTQVGHLMVITVWLGMADYDEDPPLIFGSIIKVDQRYGHEIRTATQEEALSAHLELVTMAQSLVADQV